MCVIKQLSGHPETLTVLPCELVDERERVFDEAEKQSQVTVVAFGVR